MVKILCLQGKEILPYIDDLARLRITIFHEYPYLYEGELKYEKWYLQTYVDCEESVMIVAMDDQKVVGASTAIPLKFAMKEFQQPFITQGIDVNTVFYYGESILLPAYRGQGIGKKFFQEREKIARKSGDYTIAAFCAVERPKNHPHRPKHYKELNEFWRDQGFEKHNELHTEVPWKEISEQAESLKPMVFWLKEL